MSKQLGLFGKPAVEVPKPRLGRPRKEGVEEHVAAAELAVVLSPCPAPYQVQRRNAVKHMRQELGRQRVVIEELREKIESKLSEESEGKPLEDSQKKSPKASLNCQLRCLRISDAVKAWADALS